MKRKGVAVILLCMLMLVGLGCKNNTMYSRVVSNDRYYLKLFPLNGIMGETYTLQAGDEIHVSIQKQEGIPWVSPGRRRYTRATMRIRPRLFCRSLPTAIM